MLPRLLRIFEFFAAVLVLVWFLFGRKKLKRAQRRKEAKRCCQRHNSGRLVFLQPFPLFPAAARHKLIQLLFGQICSQRYNNSMNCSRIVFIACLLVCGSLFAVEPVPFQVGEMPVEATRLSNVVMRTWGGMQFWSDEMVFRGWRIQKNAYSEHYRLLDDQNYRRAWGTLDDCLGRFDVLRKEKRLEPIAGKVVITLHGLARPRSVMEGLGEYLEKNGNYTPVNVSYASTRQSLDEHARSLEQVIKRLDGATRIDFVCHSLGNLVVRRYLARAAESESGIDPRFGRMVMLGPPNQGACFARNFESNKVFHLICGPSGKELACEWNTFEKQLATPGFDFGIIAGTKGVNPYIDQLENDIFVGVDETKLPGARDFLTCNLMHGEMMDDPKCQEYVLRFLQEGHFASEQARQPLRANEQVQNQAAQPATVERPVIPLGPVSR